MPLSLVGTFAAMYALGYSLDNLSMMALTISTGFVVDDAIVMIENIARYIEEGEPPMEAALKGAAQIGFTILSLTVSLIAVLIPLLFMGDVVGRLFREFAVTLAVTIVISARRLADAHADDVRAHPAAAAAASSRGASTGPRSAVFERMIAFYGRTLKVVLRHQTATLLVAAGDARAHGPPLHRHPQGVLPRAGHGRHPGHHPGAADDQRAGMAEKQQELATAVLEDPAVESLSSFIGADGTNTTTNSGRMSINLKPLDEREMSASDVIRRLEAEARPGPGDPALHAARAEHHGRRPRQPHAVPVHARGRGRRRAERCGGPLRRRA